MNYIYKTYDEIYKFCLVFTVLMFSRFHYKKENEINIYLDFFDNNTRWNKQIDIFDKYPENTLLKILKFLTWKNITKIRKEYNGHYWQCDVTLICDY